MELYLEHGYLCMISNTYVQFVFLCACAMFGRAEEWLLCVTAHGGSYFTTPETVMANMLDTFIVWVA